MDNPSIPNGQRVTSPEGPGDVIETIGDKVVVTLESGCTTTFLRDEIEDASSAG
ncbi:MAG: hypothetical protein ACXVJD_01235 [Mucilaginibacter sp.]